ncbi:hypothetical protein DIRU0_B12530 [Diutina rugosa]
MRVYDFFGISATTLKSRYRRMAIRVYDFFGISATTLRSRYRNQGCYNGSLGRRLTRTISVSVPVGSLPPLVPPSAYF